jgi:hypothetical protein
MSSRIFLVLKEKDLTLCKIRGLLSLTGDQTQPGILKQSETYHRGGDGYYAIYL